MRKSETMTYLFILPTIAILLLLTVYPLIYAVVTSFFCIDFLRAETAFVGLGNYLRILQDSHFWAAVRVTFIFVIAAVSLEVVLGTLFALLFNSGIRYLKLLITIVLLPMLLPPITVALTWKMMYDFNFGVANYLLGRLGVAPVEWLSSTEWALFSIIITDVWQWTPFVFLVILACLQAIPEDVYESAQVFGASSLQCFKYITFPLLKPAIVLVLLLRTIDTFRVFDKMYVLTGGGPGNATETITFYIYRAGFRHFQTGYAAAASMIMVIMVFAFSSFYIRRVLKTSNFN